MNGYEKEINSREEQKNRIRERYKGVDRSELEFIPAKPKEKLFEDTTEKRVCAYCRVSTDDVNQTSSYELQKNHYEDMIKEHQGWKLVGIYADEGISGSPIMQMVSNIMMVGVAIYLFSVKYKPSRFMILTICYFAYLIVITFIYHNKAADIHLIISNLKIVFMLCVIEYLLKRTPNSTINIMFFILITFVIIDFASIVLFPNGLYQTEQIWNEWSSSQEAQWIYGNKNNRVYWYAVLSIITWLRYVFNNKSKVMVLITSGISIVAMMLVKSSTATIVAILVSVGFFYLTYKKQTNINMNSYGILVIYGCITVLILLGSTSLLKPFVEGVLHKDMTFTGRSIAWERVLLLIASKPVFGWGVVDGETATGLLKSIAFVNPHNQLLDCLWQGGIILVFILSLIMITIASNITKIPNRSKRTGIQFVWIGLLIDMIFEVLLGTGATWIWLLLINHLYEFVYEREVS